MAEIKKRQKLPCTACGKFMFTLVVEVEHHPNGGMSDVSAGRMCAACGAILNVRASWAKLELEAQMEKIRQLREMGELELEGLLADSMKAAESAGDGLESILEVAETGRRKLSREETELGKTLDQPEEN